MLKNLLNPLCVKFSFSLQVEFHPRLCQTELRKVCVEHGVCFQAYTSLGRGELAIDPVVTEVAQRYGRTPAQVHTHTVHILQLTLFVVCIITDSKCPGLVAVGGAAGSPRPP